MAHAGPADRLFDGLLRLLPQEFRDRHGREIVQVFRAERAEACTRGERARVWLHTMLGLLQTAPAEHLSILKQDVRFAVRGLARNPIFAIAATLTLALPIGATTAMFALLNTLAFQPLPFPRAERIVVIDEISTGPAGERRAVRALTHTFRALSARDDLFEAVVAHRRRSFTFAGPEGAEWVPAAMVSSGWSGLAPTATWGRLFTPSEESGGAASRVAVVSERVATTHVAAAKGGAPATILLDGESYRIVGTLPDSYRYPYGAEIWIPGSFARGSGNLLITARPRADLGSDGLSRALAAEAARLAALDPAAYGDRGLAATPMRAGLLAGADRTAWLLLAGVALLLLIASANVMHLLFVRVAARSREFCIRGALGANRPRQIRQIVTETTVLFAVAAGAGLLAAPALGRSVFLLVPNVLRTQFGVRAIGIDGHVMAFVAGVTLGLAALFGLLAAAYAPSVSVTSTLGEELPASPGARAGRLTRIAIVTQVALALVLVSCAVFLVQGYAAMNGASLGLDPSRLLTFQVDLVSPRYEEPGGRVRAIDEAVRAVQRVPGVVAATASSVNPLCCYDWAAYLVPEGPHTAPTDPRFAVHHREVTSEFFNVLGIRLKRGRAFTEADVMTSEPVAVIDQRVADRFWPGRDPISRRLRVVYDNREQPWRTVVGVAEKVYDNGLFEATLYVPVAQQPLEPSLARIHMIIKTSGEDPLALAPAVRRAMAAADPLLAPFEITTADRQRTQALSRERLSAFMLTAFAVFGLLLASIGTYGVTASAIERRLPELGVRMAFGAGPAAIVRSAAGRALRWSAVGCAIGITGAFAAGALLEQFVFGSTTAEPAAIAAAAAVVATASLAACVIPAWHAATTPPRVALRRWE